LILFFTTKDVGVGTGQGLALAHNIIHNQHKGRITVESTVDWGSTFMISLPVNGADEGLSI
jgi:Signal transduction histidine kinase